VLVGGEPRRRMGLGKASIQGWERRRQDQGTRERGKSRAPRERGRSRARWRHAWNGREGKSARSGGHHRCASRGGPLGERKRLSGARCCGNAGAVPGRGVRRGSGNRAADGQRGRTAQRTCRMRTGWTGRCQRNGGGSKKGAGIIVIDGILTMTNRGAVPNPATRTPILCPRWPVWLSQAQ
jgi:hypothetical protein